MLDKPSKGVANKGIGVLGFPPCLLPGRAVSRTVHAHLRDGRCSSRGNDCCALVATHDRGRLQREPEGLIHYPAAFYFNQPCYGPYCRYCTAALTITPTVATLPAYGRLLYPSYF